MPKKVIEDRLLKLDCAYKLPDCEGLLKTNPDSTGVGLA